MNQPIDSGFYDLELPDAFRWMKQEAKCLISPVKVCNFSQPVLVITTNRINAETTPSLSVYLNGIPIGTQHIDRYGSYYYAFKPSGLNISGFIEITLKTDCAKRINNDSRLLGIPIYKIDFIDLDSGWDGFEERQYLADQINIFKAKESILSSELHNLQLNSRSMILDVGAGMGWTSVLLAARTGSKVCAIDLHRHDELKGTSFKSEVLNRFKRHVPVLVKEPDFRSFHQLEQVIERCTFLTMNAEQLSFEDRTFNIVFSLNTFEHIANPLKALNEISRTLKPGGQAFLEFQPIYFSDVGHHLFGLTHVPWIHLLYNSDEIKKMILDSGKVPNEVDNILNSLNGFTLKQYLDMFSNTGLKIVKMQIHRGFSISGAEYSEEFRKLNKIYPEEELTTKGMSVLLKKNTV